MSKHSDECIYRNVNKKHKIQIQMYIIKLKVKKETAIISRCMTRHTFENFISLFNLLRIDSLSQRNNDRFDISNKLYGVRVIFLYTNFSLLKFHLVAVCQEHKQKYRQMDKFDVQC